MPTKSIHSLPWAGCGLVVCTAWCWGVASGAEPATHESAALVQQLGGATYAEREDASQRLIELGMAAWAALQTASASPDPEVRYRARRVMTVVEAAELERQLQRFEQDLDGTTQIALPGWQLYCEVAGDSPQSRRLFVDMGRAEPDLLRALSGPRARLCELVIVRCWQLQFDMQQAAMARGQSRFQQPEPGSVAMLLFAGALDDVSLDEQSASLITNHISRLLQPGVKQAGNDGNSSPQRRLLSHWIGRDWSNMPMGAYQAMMLSMSYELPEGLEVALATLAVPGGQPHLRQFAALTVGKFGTGEHVPRLLPLLEDESVCWNRQGDEIPTEVRDVTLAVLIQMTGQKPQDYRLGGLQANRTLYLNASSVQFRSKSDRTAALARWKQWYSEHGPSLTGVKNS